MRGSGRRPHWVKGKQALVNERMDRIPMPQRWYSADGKSCGRANEIGIRLDDLRVKVGGNQLLIDAVTPACNNKHRLIGIGALKYQGFGNLLDLATNCRSGIFGGTGRLRQHHDSCINAFRSQDLLDGSGGVWKLFNHAAYSELALET